MMLKVWRYAHLALALFSSIFLIISSVTGVILAIDVAVEKSYPYKSKSFDEIKLSDFIANIKEKYVEVYEVNIDDNQFVSIEAIDEDGNEVSSIIDPKTGDILGDLIKKHDFFQWNINFHRSLFLKETGRFIVGITSFLLVLIVISGTVLIIKRQKSVFRFFSKINRDFLAQYYHVVAGRILLVPILIIAATGVYLFVERFEIIKNVEPELIEYQVTGTNSVSDSSPSNFFNTTLLKDIMKIEFPFVEDPEEYFRFKLKDREVIVHQFTGEKISERNISTVENLKRWSLLLHTGKINLIWAIILGIASLNIVFFMYSGIRIFLKRIATKIKNPHSEQEAEYVVFVGTENGSTLGFAAHIHQQLLAAGKKSYLTEMNHLSSYPNAKHFVVFTSTYGIGDAPNNASQFVDFIRNYQSNSTIQYSVVGFGSKIYKDYCAYAYQIDHLLSEQQWTEPVLDVFTVNEKSPTEFVSWVQAWSEKCVVPLATTVDLYSQQPTRLKSFQVVEKKNFSNEDTFILILKPISKIKFQSGDLLAIYPNNDYKERFYSISKIGDNIQLVVKNHQYGLGSQFLYQLEKGIKFKAKVFENSNFHFQSDTTKIAMIANGTGIAPFLGMLANNTLQINAYLYCGFRFDREVANYYKDFLEGLKFSKYLTDYKFCFSKEKDAAYVMDMVRADKDIFVDILKSGGVIMICGSLSMYQDVIAEFDKICIANLNHNIKYYQSRSQILSDCY
ncbi:MAG: PepSY domain-containing protein [Chitinophagales bacterium]|nr:PepSY domain-containing protein [Chitinophagales bacterium]